MRFIPFIALIFICSCKGPEDCQAILDRAERQAYLELTDTRKEIVMQRARVQYHDCMEDLINK